MSNNQSKIEFLLAHPSEGLNAEIKNWIDPRTVEGQAKIIKAAFALRNRNGGYLVVGVDDRTHVCEPYVFDIQVEELFHTDAIQELISRHAFETFEINVGYGSVNGQSHPVISIPEGVKTPVSVKTPLTGKDGKQYLKTGDIYFRTLGANGTPSSAQVHARDYPTMLEICFDNREADIGRFLRRQLGTSDTLKLAATLNLLTQPKTTVKEQAIQVMADGKSAFAAAINRKPLNPEFSEVLEYLTMNVCLVLNPQKEGEVPTQTFLNTVEAANPKYTGWPMWFDGRGYTPESRPYVLNDHFESLINGLEGDVFPRFDFVRFNPNGALYMRRTMHDDFTDKVPPRTALDRGLMIFRVAEVLAVGISIARSLGWQGDDSAGFLFEWEGLENRQLRDWANPMRMIGGRGQSHTNTAASFLEVSLDTPHAALAPHVAKAVGPLFAQFDGYQLSPGIIEELVQKLVERKL